MLFFGELPPRDEYGRYGHRGNLWVLFDLCYPSGRNLDLFRQKWVAVRDELLAAWVAERPGTRPFGWWLLESPRSMFEGVPTPGPEPRRHVSGCGRPEERGVYPSDLAMSHGVLPIRDIDPNDPPVLESEPAYLRRHGVLDSAELARLEDRDFAPEPLEP